MLVKIEYLFQDCKLHPNKFKIVSLYRNLSMSQQTAYSNINVNEKEFGSSQPQRMLDWMNDTAI